MNTNPNAKVVLCYGDSNTWGQNDDRNNTGRYAADSRWTGGLQTLLGDDYRIVEEGLPGRTTDLDHYNPDKPFRNGLTYFIPCFGSHQPLDVVIIMLGTNDLKVQYDRPAEDTVHALTLYIDFIKAKQPNANIVLVSPILINDQAPGLVEHYSETYDAKSADKSRQLGGLINRLADDTGCAFFDASTVAKPGLDGIHMDEASHTSLAKSLSEIIRHL